MTREEAAHIVDVAFGVPQAVRRAGEDRTYHEKEIREAKNMAIKALEQDVPDINVGDMISRQKAIDAIDALYLDGDSPASHLANAEGDTLIGKYQAITALDDLPSVNPQSCEDAVSRNLITQTLNKMDRYVAEELTLCDTDKKFPKNEVFIVDDVYEEIVEQLSPVNPQQKTGHWEWAQYDSNPNIGNWQCSECRCVVIECGDKKSKGDIPLYKYCPQCGCRIVEL